MHDDFPNVYSGVCLPLLAYLGALICVLGVIVSGMLLLGGV